MRRFGDKMTNKPTTIPAFMVAMLLFAAAPTPAATTHATIDVRSETSFEALATAEGWPGDGTAGNPYRIEGYTINASAAHGMRLENLNFHVLVTNNTIYEEDGGAHYGVWIRNSPNIDVVNNKLLTNSQGIRLTLGTFGTWTFGDNTIRGATTGIYIGGQKEGFTVSGNDIRDVGTAIYMESNADDGLVIGNEIHDCSKAIHGQDRGQTNGRITVESNHIESCSWGIVIEDTLDVTNNTLLGLSKTAIVTWYGSGTVGGNVIDGANYGLVLDANGLSVMDNQVRNITYDGLRSDALTTITGNVFEFIGRYGIDAQAVSSPGLLGGSPRGIQDNIVRHTGSTGMRVELSSDFTNNTVEYTGGSGIAAGFGDAQGNTVRFTARHGITEAQKLIDNTVTDAGGDGLRTPSFSSGQVTGNVVQRVAGTGIRLTGSSASDNLVEDAGGDGISGGGSYTGNTVRRSGGDGLIGQGRLSNNVVEDNGGDGARMTGASSAVGNQASGNGGTGLSLSVDADLFPTTQSISGNTLSGNARGLHLAGGQIYAIRDNVFTGNGVGLELSDPDASDAVPVEVFNNHFDNSIDALVPVGYPAQWYTAPIPTNGPNIIGGPTIGGNSWSGYAGTDLDADGFGDTPHQPTADPARLDRYPLV